MDEAKIRAWWSQRQGLDGRATGQSPARVLEQTGWARSVGGVGPYLTLFSRGGIGREAVDSAVAKLEIHELPAARGCTYVLPSSDFALGLKVGEGFHDGDMKVARKLGVTDAEVYKLSAAVLSALGDSSLDPDELRKAVGGATRSLGEEGKKKGLSTTLPLSLGRLQGLGVIRRVPVNGRLDQQRYRYVRWDSPLPSLTLSLAEAFTELARRYFTWIGPATLTEFQWFSGLGVKASKDAVASLNLQPLGPEDDRLMLPGLRQELEAFVVPVDPQYVLVSALDGISLLRRDLRSLMTAEHRKNCVPVERGHKELGSLQDLPSHAILDRGTLIGLWEYDPEAEDIAWMSFVPKNDALCAAVERTAAYIRSDLGDARSFSLDSPKSRAPRIAALRQSASVSL